MSSPALAGLVVWWLAHDEGLRVTEISRMTGVNVQRAAQLIRDLAQVFYLERDAFRYWSVISWQAPRIPARIPNYLKGALLAWELALGHPVTSRSAAEMLGCTQRQARNILYELSGVLPIAQPRECGPWVVVTGEEEWDDEECKE